MTTLLQKVQSKRSNVLEKIKVEAKVDEGMEVIVRCDRNCHSKMERIRISHEDMD